MRRLRLATTLSLAAAGTFLLVSPGAASAVEQDCTVGVDRLVKPHEGWARCGIGAKFRVVLACKTSASATDATKYNGPWVMPPGTSRAACPSAKPYIAEAGFERDS